MSAAFKTLTIAKSPAPRVARNLAEVRPVGEVLDAPLALVGAALHEIRIHHWIKNLLLFVSVVAAHRLFPLDWLRHCSHSPRSVYAPRVSMF